MTDIVFVATDYIDCGEDDGTNPPFEPGIQTLNIGVPGATEVGDYILMQVVVYNFANEVIPDIRCTNPANDTPWELIGSVQFSNQSCNAMFGKIIVQEDLDIGIFTWDCRRIGYFFGETEVEAAFRSLTCGVYRNVDTDFPVLFWDGASDIDVSDTSDVIFPDREMPIQNFHLALFAFATQVAFTDPVSSTYSTQFGSGYTPALPIKYHFTLHDFNTYDISELFNKTVTGSFQTDVTEVIFNPALGGEFNTGYGTFIVGLRPASEDVPLSTTVVSNAPFATSFHPLLISSDVNVYTTDSGGFESTDTVFEKWDQASATLTTTVSDKSTLDQDRLLEVDEDNGSLYYTSFNIDFLSVVHTFVIKASTVDFSTQATSGDIGTEIDPPFSARLGKGWSAGKLFVQTQHAVHILDSSTMTAGAVITDFPYDLLHSRGTSLQYLAVDAAGNAWLPGFYTDALDVFHVSLFRINSSHNVAEFEITSDIGVTPNISSILNLGYNPTLDSLLVTWGSAYGSFSGISQTLPDTGKILNWSIPDETVTFSFSTVIGIPGFSQASFRALDRTPNPTQMWLPFIQSTWGGQPYIFLAKLNLADLTPTWYSLPLEYCYVDDIVPAIASSKEWLYGQKKLLWSFNTDHLTDPQTCDLLIMPESGSGGGTTFTISLGNSALTTWITGSLRNLGPLHVSGVLALSGIVFPIKLCIPLFKSIFKLIYKFSAKK